MGLVTNGQGTNSTHSLGGLIKDIGGREGRFPSRSQPCPVSSRQRPSTTDHTPSAQADHARCFSQELHPIHFAGAVHEAHDLHLQLS
jgi:hypothetical protein